LTLLESRGGIERGRQTGFFLREDFADLGAYDVMGRELRKLVRDGALVRVGYGLYARAKRSVLSGIPIPVRLSSISATRLCGVFTHA
jgi:Transcriptional regulator, AbiEi antitoxin